MLERFVKNFTCFVNILAAFVIKKGYNLNFKSGVLATLKFLCTLTLSSTNTGVEHVHKLQHHSPVQNAAETAE